jgi:hypothetical protein
MLPNSTIVAISSLLAASCFLGPLIFKSTTRPMRVICLAILYGATFFVLQVISDTRAGVAVIELALIFAEVAYALHLNFKMVHLNNYPKYHRCY